VRVGDPFETVEIDPKRTVPLTLGLVVALVVAATLFPTQAAVVAVILALFVMIMLHEFGHFLAAKRSGMKVTEFFVGFGPRLWSFRRGETEYGVKAVPLGGYCRIIGMTNLEDVDPGDEPRAYRNKRAGQKVLVAGAGPATHFVIAVILMFTVLFFGGDYRHATQSLTLAATSQGAQQAGVRAGDTIVSVNGTPVTEWSQVSNLINSPGHPAKAGDVATFVVRRGGEDLTLPVTLQPASDDASRIIAGVQADLVVPHPGFVASIGKAPVEVGVFSWESTKAIGTMFSPSGIANYFRILAGDTSSHTDQSKRFVSPAGVGSLATDAVRAGWVSVLGLLIAINVFVALFNLLPLLPFDGGHIAIALYEKIASAIRHRRVQVDAAKLMPLTVAVVAVLGFIFLSSLFLDITRPVANPF
jgi:membrane-associated protease RseP (regulator of RpoE activity)